MPLSKQKLNEKRHRQIEQPLNADWFYRLIDGHKYFGYGPTVIDQKIRSGEIPPPVPLSDTGRAKGWFGRTIIAWQAERQAKAAAMVAPAKPKQKSPQRERVEA